MNRESVLVMRDWLMERAFETIGSNLDMLRKGDGSEILVFFIDSGRAIAAEVDLFTHSMEIIPGRPNRRDSSENDSWRRHLDPDADYLQVKQTIEEAMRLQDDVERRVRLCPHEEIIPRGGGWEGLCAVCGCYFRKAVSMRPDTGDGGPTHAWVLPRTGEEWAWIY